SPAKAKIAKSAVQRSRPGVPRKVIVTFRSASAPNSTWQFSTIGQYPLGLRNHIVDDIPCRTHIIEQAGSLADENTGVIHIARFARPGIAIELPNDRVRRAQFPFTAMPIIDETIS